MFVVHFLSMKSNIKVIIPAYNEENSVGRVIKDIPSGLVTEIIVVNNASTDETAIEAQKYGATVLQEPIAGYGKACLKGLSYLEDLAEEIDIVVFLDADYSDHPEVRPRCVAPIIENDMYMVIGSRALGL